MNRHLAGPLVSAVAGASLLVGCAVDDETPPATPDPAPTTTTSIDPYGDDPDHDQGLREDVCRNGDAANRPGRRRLAAFIANEWPEVDDVIGYECREINNPSIPVCDGELDAESSPCWSTHASGRAIDVIVGGEQDAPTPEGVVLGDRIVTAFLAEGNGVAHYLARTTGVQEIIWNDRCWYPDDADVTAAADMHSCPISGHDNHVHLTLSNEGADGETSWYP